MNQEKELYGQKEVPNIKINFLGDFIKDSFIRKIEYTLECNTINGYYEEYDSDEGYKITFTTQVLPLDELEKMYYWDHFTAEIEEIRRNEKGEDKVIHRTLTGFNNINIKHKLYSEGEPTIWYITLCHKKRPYVFHQKEESKKEIKNIKITKPLKKVSSDTLGEVKL